MSEDSPSFIRRVSSFVENLISFILIVLMAAFVLFALGWVLRVCFGGETTSEYISHFTDFYRDPRQTEVGQWLNGLYRRIRS